MQNIVVVIGDDTVDDRVGNNDAVGGLNDGCDDDAKMGDDAVDTIVGIDEGIGDKAVVLLDP